LIVFKIHLVFLNKILDIYFYQSPGQLSSASQ
jgi:hypothetical protein